MFQRTINKNASDGRHRLAKSSSTKDSPAVLAHTMPDIFIWAPEEDAAALNIGPYCAFSSHSSLQSHFIDDEEYESFSDTSDFEDEAEGEDGDAAVRPRRPSLQVDTRPPDQISDSDAIAWTREILHAAPQEQPSPSSKSFLAKASAFIRSFTFGGKDKSARSQTLLYSPKVGKPPSITRPPTPAMRSGTGSERIVETQTLNRRVQFTDSPTTGTKSKNRTSLFALTERNRSATVLSAPSNGRANDQAPLDHVSSPIFASLSDPCTTAQRPVLRPQLRKTGSSPASMRSSEILSEADISAIHRPDQFVAPQLESAFETDLDKIAHRSDTSSMTDTESSDLQTPEDGMEKIDLSSLDHHAKLPSIPHVDAMSHALRQL